MKSYTFWHFVKRITIVHVFTYLIAGLFFMQLMNYWEEFSTNEAFSNFRSIDSPIVQAAVLFQIIRGAFFGVILFPFRKVIVDSKLGWLYLWGLILGFTSIGAVNTAPGSIEGMIYTTLNIKAHLIGYPEVITQTFLFSVLFFWWERKKSSH